MQGGRKSMPETVVLRAILTDLLQLAQAAYWNDYRDCGSDWEKDSECVDCRHNEACGLAVSINRGITRLSQGEA